jgi:hypothetical protein
LADTTPTGFSVISSSKVNWADLLDADELDERPSQSIGTILLPNAPKSTRGPDFDVSHVPTEEPFLAYMRNLPSEVSADDVTRFFKNLEIKNVEVERGTVPSQTVAIVEFFDRETLIEGLCRNHETMRSREVQISHSDPRNRSRYGDRGYGDRGDRDRGYGRDRERSGYGRERENSETGDNDTDWRSNSRPVVAAQSGREDRYGGRSSGERRWGSGGSGNFESGRDFGRSGYGNRMGDGNRDGPGRYDRGYDRPADNADEEPREYQRLQLSKPTKKAAEADSEFPVAPLNQALAEGEISPLRVAEPQPQIPLERKKLVLLPPTKKEAVEPVDEEAKRSASIFGDAKPVDTTKKLVEFERKQQDRVKVVEKPLPSRSSDAGSVSGSEGGSQSGREPRRIDGGDRPAYSRGGGSRNFSGRPNDHYDSAQGRGGRFVERPREDYRNSRDNREPREYRDNRDFRDNRQVRDNREPREPRSDADRQPANSDDQQEYRSPRNQGRAPRIERTVENGIVSLLFTIYFTLNLFDLN